MTAASPSLDARRAGLDPLHSFKRSLSPQNWRAPVVHSECSLHQLSPYIGKLKSSIAGDLVQALSRPGELVVDPFSGAGTIAFEASLAGRRVFASDLSPYAYALTHAKLNAPRTLDAAVHQIQTLLEESAVSASPDLRAVPRWVRAYFNPRTLKEAISFSNVCQDRQHTLGLSCLLGILHHQRPGFLSYPSSHLVPYLREKNFPAEDFPALYEYRALRPRILSKVVRAYKRVDDGPRLASTVVQSSIEDVILPARVDAVITSPPYMNALDYGRDNRLRLWFMSPTAAEAIDDSTPSTILEFARIMSVLAIKVSSCLKVGGYCVLVIGEAVSRGTLGHTASTAVEVFTSGSYPFQLVQTVSDLIPDVRRARRDCRGVKVENVIVLRRVK
jgi:D12 class N6 adenine-specific DNA methyltransferase